MTHDEIDKKWMARAIKSAQKAAQIGEVPVGAVLVGEHNNLLARAYNQPIKKHDASAHAEIEVIRKAGKKQQNYRLPNTTLYVTLEPCPMCAGAIIHARIARVVFAARDPRAGACGSVFELHRHAALNHRFDIDFQESTEYIALLKAFFKARR